MPQDFNNKISTFWLVPKQRYIETYEFFFINLYNISDDDKYLVNLLAVGRNTLKVIVVNEASFKCLYYIMSGPHKRNVKIALFY